MDRSDLLDASSSAALRLPICGIQPDRAAASQMTAFTRALEVHTGHIFANYEALHEFSVRDYRTFWSFLSRWSRHCWTKGWRASKKRANKKVPPSKSEWLNAQHPLISEANPSAEHVVRGGRNDADAPICDRC